MKNCNIKSSCNSTSWTIPILIIIRNHVCNFLFAQLTYIHCRIFVLGTGYGNVIHRIEAADVKTVTIKRYGIPPGILIMERPSQIMMANHLLYEIRMRSLCWLDMELDRYFILLSPIRTAADKIICINIRCTMWHQIKYTNETTYNYGHLFVILRCRQDMFLVLSSLLRGMYKLNGTQSIYMNYIVCTKIQSYIQDLNVHVCVPVMIQDVKTKKGFVAVSFGGHIMYNDNNKHILYFIYMFLMRIGTRDEFKANEIGLNICQAHKDTYSSNNVLGNNMCRNQIGKHNNKIIHKCHRQCQTDHQQSNDEIVTRFGDVVSSIVVGKILNYFYWVCIFQSFMAILTTLYRIFYDWIQQHHPNNILSNDSNMHQTEDTIIKQCDLNDTNSHSNDTAEIYVKYKTLNLVMTELLKEKISIFVMGVVEFLVSLDIVDKGRYCCQEILTDVDERQEIIDKSDWKSSPPEPTYSIIETIDIFVITVPETEPFYTIPVQETIIQEDCVQLTSGLQSTESLITGDIMENG